MGLDIAFGHRAGIVGIDLLTVLLAGPRREPLSLLQHATDRSTRSALFRGKVLRPEVPLEGVAKRFGAGGCVVPGAGLPTLGVADSEPELAGPLHPTFELGAPGGRGRTHPPRGVQVVPLPPVLPRQS